jgi:hypothetical protein
VANVRFTAIRALGLGRPGAALTYCPAWICIFESITDIGLMATQLKQRVNQLTLDHSGCSPWLTTVRW